MKKLLTVLEAARIAGLSSSALYQAIREGRLKGRRHMGRQMVHMDDLAAYHLARLKIEGGKA